MVSSKRSKTVRLAMICLGILIILGLGVTMLINQLLRYDAAIQQDYLNQAKRIAIDTAIYKCKAEQKDNRDCTRMSADGSASECEGEPCWIIYAKTDDSTYGASITTEFNRGDHMVASDYLRDTGSN